MTAFPKPLALLLLLGVILSFACKKPVLDDDGLLPDEQLGLFFTDTLTVIAEVVVDDSVIADGLGTNIWGSMNDPVFGKSYGGIYFQMSTDRSNIDFGNNLTLDSLVLTLLYSDTSGYGNLSIPQNLNIYRVTEPFSKDSTYYQFKTFSTASTPLATINGYVPNFSDSLTVNDSVKYKPGLRIKLDNALGNEILANSGLNNLASDAAFKAFLNGLYLAPDTNNVGAGMVYFDLYNANSKLTIYYNSGQSFDFLINGNSATVNHYRHNYSGTPVQSSIGGSTNDEILYVQPMAGVSVKVTVPYIGNLQGIAINKAELVFTDIATDTATFKAPNQLIVTQTLEDGTEDLVPDQLLGGTFAGGTRRTETNSLGNQVWVYKINVPRYLQQVMSTGEQFGLNLLTFPTAGQANRVILGGSTHAQHPLKLRLTYTKID